LHAAADGGILPRQVVVRMKRKIAAIFAADIAGYSRLVAEDEEETLRRLASYRAVVDDFIDKASGRIFNTAGDAVLAEFPSAVDAVRCAIDIQESLRTRGAQVSG
jgi:adenylate cyclase